MATYRSLALFLILGLSLTTLAQDTSLTRADVTAIKAKLVTVQKAMGADPEGYLKESEDFYLPTDASPAQGGKFWPLTSSISLSYTGRAAKEGIDSAEQASKDFQARYAAAMASGDPNAMMQMSQEMMRISQLAAAAGMNPQTKNDMTVYIQFNMSPFTAIDPDAVVMESPGVIALRDTDVSGEEGQVTVYLDPVALKQTETLSKIELTTPNDGVKNRIGVFNITIQLNGTITDIESWVQTFDAGEMLSVIDSQ